MTTGAEVKFLWFSAKTLFWPMIALYFSPIYDWIILQQMVTDYSLLTNIEKAVLNDAKLIGGVLLCFFALTKLAFGTYKIRKEIKLMKANPEKEVK